MFQHSFGSRAPIAAAVWMAFCLALAPIRTNGQGPGAPDLRVVSVDTSGLTGDWQVLTVTGALSAVVQNAGSAAAGPFTVTFFEDGNHNGVFNAVGDRLFGTAAVGGLAAGAQVVASITTQAEILFRDNLIHAFVDSANTVAESNEGNNVGHSGQPCLYQPAPSPFAPALEWSWTSSAIAPTALNVMGTPAVIDLDGDGAPEVVFTSTSSTGGGYVEVGFLRAVHGANGSEFFTITDPNQLVNTAASVAVGDIDGDGAPEILACHASGNRLIAFEADGTFKWLSAPLEVINWGAPSIADLNGDGVPEIVIGRQALDNLGNVLWTGTGGNGSGGNVGPLSIVADLDLDGTPEIIAGNTAYRASGAIYWQASIPDGYAAVGNFDADSFPEVVIVGGGSVYLLNHDGTPVWGPIAIPGGGYGGPPTIANYDTDTQPEIGVAGAARYVVFETNGTVKWQSVTQDGSSNRTGSSVFDFEGDGIAEVVYRDELFLRVYRGTDGTVLFQTAMSSCTWYEYVLVADVDGDGNAEILAVANNNCGFGPQRGVYVFGDPADNWVATRRIWNEHAYHITNVNDDGTIPAHEDASWLFPSGAPYNSYRQNVLAGGLQATSAPDLTASRIRVVCGPSNATLTGRVGNGGSVIAGAGIPVSFYAGNPAAGGILLGTVTTPVALAPGYFVDVAFSPPTPITGNIPIYFAADDLGGLVGTQNECREGNNVFGINGCVPAVAANYGAGWPGTLGIPTLSANVAPALCRQMAITIGNSRGVATPAALLLGRQPASVAFGIGGLVLVDPFSPLTSILEFTMPASGSVLSFQTPGNIFLCGETFYMQVVMFDPGASQSYAFTRGLQSTIGL